MIEIDTILKQYQSDLKMLLALIEHQSIDCLVYTGKSAALMGEDLRRNTRATGNNLPPYVELKTPKNYLDPSYEAQLREMKLDGQVAVLEDYSYTGTKILALAEFLPPNVILDVLVSANFACTIPGRVNVIDKNNNELVFWLEQRAHPNTIRSCRF